MEKLSLTGGDLAKIRESAINMVRDQAYANDRDIGMIATLLSLNGFLESKGIETNFKIDEQYIIGRNNYKKN